MTVHCMHVVLSTPEEGFRSDGAEITEGYEPLCAGVET